jgi:hypothetical protein
MLYILHSSHPTARMRYAAKLLFQELLGLDWEFVQEVPEGRTYIQYGGDPQPQALLYIPASGLLERKSIEVSILPGEDLLAKAFWWATGYAYQATPRYDANRRYHFANYEHIAAGLHRQPQVHLLAAKLEESLKAHFPVKRKEFETEITFDIDHPWRYKNKPVHVTAGSLVKKLFRGNVLGFMHQASVILGKKDPNDVFDELFQHFPPETTRLFFLIERRHPNDTRHTWRNPAMQKLIRRAHGMGFGIGIHPSFITYLQADLIKEEIDRLTDIIGEEVTHSRMHFLRYRQPETFRALLKAGIKHDYTTGLYHDTGFPYGMAQPFNWFDLEKNRETELLLHPTSLMDRTLLSYMQLSPQEAVAHYTRMQKEVELHHGTFIPLFHNEVLSDHGEWKGWRKLAKCEDGSRSGIQK